MNRTQHPSNNKVLGAPVDWNHRELPCSALPVTCVVIEGAGHAMKSYWKSSDEEIEKIMAGGQVVLWTFGHAHPAVAIEVE